MTMRTAVALATAIAALGAPAAANAIEISPNENAEPSEVGLGRKNECTVPGVLITRAVPNPTETFSPGFVAGSCTPAGQ